VTGYQHFGGQSCLHLHPEDGRSMALCNNGILPHHYTASQSRRSQHVSSSLISDMYVYTHFINTNDIAAAAAAGVQNSTGF